MPPSLPAVSEDSEEDLLTGEKLKDPASSRTGATTRARPAWTDPRGGPRPLACPASPPGPETFDGRGMIVTLQVDDAAAWHAHLRDAGVAIAHPLTDAPWGQRRFMVADPSGIQIDLVEQIEPAPGFWDPYV